MLRITIHPEAGPTKLKVEGSLKGPWVEALADCWRRLAGAGRGPVTVDLGGVTFVDDAGKALLSLMCREGATLQGAGCLITAIVNEIKAAECRHRAVHGDRGRGSTPRGNGGA